MIRNIIFLSMIIIGTILSSCSNTGKQVEASDAQKVKVVDAVNATILNAVQEGSIVNWRAAHLGGVNPRMGKISIKDAHVKIENGTIIGANIVIDMASIVVENFPTGAKEIEEIRGHLLSPDFFNVENFPTAKFELTNFENGGREQQSKITGNLTILDVTKSITFNAKVKVGEDIMAIVSEDFSIDRREWGLTYNIEGTAGVPVDYLIANDIGFTISVNFIK